MVKTQKTVGRMLKKTHYRAVAADAEEAMDAMTDIREDMAELRDTMEVHSTTDDADILRDLENELLDEELAGLLPTPTETEEKEVPDMELNTSGAVAQPETPRAQAGQAGQWTQAPPQRTEQRVVSFADIEEAVEDESGTEEDERQPLHSLRAL